MLDWNPSDEERTMHESSYRHMAELVERYLASLQNMELRILDIGSFDINGSYRPLFQNANWDYKGADLTAGPNVDIILPDPYSWRNIRTHSFDMIISGQTFEHIEFFWLTWIEAIRVLKPGGLIFLIAPSQGPEHRHPVDCWRFYPDGFRALAKYGGLELLEVSTDWEQDIWGDTVGVFRKSSSAGRMPFDILVPITDSG